VATRVVNCPCGGGDYERCCGRFHQGAVPDHAERLMRSRYSAYVLGLGDYLTATWHPATRPETIDVGGVEAKATRWLGLDVKRHTTDGDRALVEFVARYRVGGASAQRLHEISRFERIGGRWYYRDGEFPVR
jgi:SEC-C motif-containing protein